MYSGEPYANKQLKKDQKLHPSKEAYPQPLAQLMEDIVTLFHKASSPASVRVATLLKQASANATEHATEDQASDHSAQTTPHRAEFELNITEDPPTPDQLQTILQYVGSSAISSVVKGASTESEALKIFKQSAEAFQRPVVCSTRRSASSSCEPPANTPTDG